MAHVCGHVDFFKNNYYFSNTNRQMIDGMANHATRVRRHIERAGRREVVEDFIDTCLSLENLIDSDVARTSCGARPPKRAARRRRARARGRAGFAPRGTWTSSSTRRATSKRRRRSAKKKRRRRSGGSPSSPQRDVLLFLIEHAPLERWERDVLEIVRDEAYYFAPQAHDEDHERGLGHVLALEDHDREGADGVRDHRLRRRTLGRARDGAGPAQPVQARRRALRDIEDRWNKGQFGKEWDECDDHGAEAQLGPPLGLGRQKIFEVRKLYNDMTFLDEFFTLEFCHRAEVLHVRLQGAHAATGRS